jgi:O-antigen/teichoic acid export membrane protein
MKSVDNNKRIAKNTLLLYIRMFFTMAISLYTSRIILSTLGISDFGLYSVVGGVVSSFIFLNGAMASSTQRYLTFELEKGDIQKLREVFSISLIFHFSIAILLFVLAETVGLWFLINKMTIPENRRTAAMWVYQFSILNVLIIIISVPYNALIIANEKMKAFAYISVLEVVLKLAIVFLLGFLEYDKLIVYAMLYFSLQLVIRFVYGRYCRLNFPETKFEYKKYDVVFMKEMGAFAGWHLIGNFSAMTFTQGVNILLNIFYGPVLNAARGIAVQVQGVISQFFVNFQMALNPQITKSYAADNHQYMYSLIYGSSKFTFYLLLLLCLPLYIETEYVLSLWLKEVPPNTVIFLRLILVSAIIDAVANPLIISAMATGKVKKFEIVIGLILLLILPVSYFCLTIGCPSYSVFIIQIVFVLMAYIARLLMIKSMIGLPLRVYFSEVLIKIFLVIILSVPLPILLKIFLPYNFTAFVTVCLFSIINVIVVVYTIGLSCTEKNFVKDKLFSFVKNKI